MMNVATRQGCPFEDLYLSEGSSQSLLLIRSLFEVGRESGADTSLTKTESTIRPTALARRFQSLAKTWREETRYLSSVHDMVLHPAYQQIIGMGRDALPFLFEELKRQPDHWFWALHAITGEDPVPPEEKGNLGAMIRRWLHWGAANGWVRNEQ